MICKGVGRGKMTMGRFVFSGADANYVRSAVLYNQSRASTGPGTRPCTGPGLGFIKISGIRVLTGPGRQYRLH